MSEQKRGSVALKFLIGFGAGALVGAGLCGVSFAKAMVGDARAYAMTTLGGNVFAWCVWGAIGSVIWWIVARGKGEGR